MAYEKHAIPLKNRGFSTEYVILLNRFSLCMYSNLHQSFVLFNTKVFKTWLSPCKIISTIILPVRDFSPQPTFKGQCWEMGCGFSWKHSTSNWYIRNFFLSRDDTQKNRQENVFLGIRVFIWGSMGAESLGLTFVIFYMMIYHCQ